MCWRGKCNVFSCLPIQTMPFFSTYIFVSIFSSFFSSLLPHFYFISISRWIGVCLLCCARNQKATIYSLCFVCVVRRIQKYIHSSLSFYFYFILFVQSDFYLPRTFHSLPSLKLFFLFLLSWFIFILWVLPSFGECGGIRIGALFVYTKHWRNKKWRNW